MSQCSILFVDRHGARTANIRAYCQRYAVDLALALEAEKEDTNASAFPRVVHGTHSAEYAYSFIVLDQACELEIWRNTQGDQFGKRIALLNPQYDGDQLAIYDAHFDWVFPLPFDAGQLETLFAAHISPAALDGDDYLNTLPMLDDESAHAAAMGDTELVTELRTMLRDDIQKRIPQVSQELAANDVAQAAETVHRLVGGSAYCGAKAMQVTSLELENCLRQREWEQLDALYGRWLLAAEALIPALSKA